MGVSRDGAVELRLGGAYNRRPFLHACAHKCQNKYQTKIVDKHSASLTKYTIFQSLLSYYNHIIGQKGCALMQCRAAGNFSESLMQDLLANAQDDSCAIENIRMWA